MADRQVAENEMCEIAQLRARIESLELREEERKAYSIAAYFSKKRGLPRLRQDGSTSSTSINQNHSNVKELRECDFGCLNLPTEEQMVKLENIESSLLRIKGPIGYSTEMDVQFRVLELMNNMLVAAELTEDLVLRNDLQIHDLKADIWVVSYNGHPVGAIEVKKPGKNLQNVEGQLMDYMLKIRSFHGLRHVYGIVTDFEHWRICWLPDSSDAAAATDLAYTLDAAIDPDAAANPVLCGTRLLSSHTPDQMSELARTLVSVLIKMHHSRDAADRSSMALYSEDRCYIMICEDSWFWTTLNSTHLKAVRNVGRFSLVPPKSNTKTFILLRDYHGGNDGRVWLAASVASGKIMVVKFLSRLREDQVDNGMELVDKERDYWHKCGIKSVFSTKLINRPALVMPFCFHCHKQDGSPPAFVTSPDTWTDGSNRNLGDVDIGLLQECQNAIQNKDPKEVLRECVDHMAKLKLVHDDMHWRHVAVMPRFKQEADHYIFCDFYSTFIDLGRVSVADNEEQARQKMQPMLLELLRLADT